ncbi:hypothetical protein ACKFKF_15045 [Phormidesmis sp. 146-12]
MTVSVLTQDFRQQLEQQRDRLTHERSAIVQSAIDRATAEIDRSLNHIEGLLSELSTPLTKSRTEGEAIEPTNAPDTQPTSQQQTSQRGRKAAVKTSEAFPEKASGRRKSAPKAEPALVAQSSRQPKAKREKKVFETPTLKREFKDLPPAKALERVMVASPDQIFTTDRMIEVLFGSLDDAVLPRTRQSVALMFSHGLRRQDYIKVQEDPAQYRLNPDKRTESAA